MATYAGKSGTIEAVTTGGSLAAVGEIKNYSLTINAETVDDTALGDSFTSCLLGVKSWEVSLEAHYYPGDTAQADLIEGATVDLAMYPSAEVATREQFTGTGIVTSINIGGLDNASVVSYAVTIKGNGNLTRGVVPA